MSYAGTYGPSETCEHDRYRPNCQWCNGSVERFARELPIRLQHPSDAESIEIEERHITVFSAACPNRLCSWKRVDQHSRQAVEEDLRKHDARCEEVRRTWASATDMQAEARRRGLLP